MAKSKLQQNEEKLRFRVNQYLNEQKWGLELKKALLELESHGCSTYMVGGFLRDLMLDGLAANPRDIDIVFEGISADKVEFLFWNQPKRKNRFGGMRLEFGDFPLDVWPLKETWAFRSGKIRKADASTFPQTTFLNVDAIAFRWRHDGDSEIFSNGFFEGILNRTLEINLEENPYPETCIVRALMLASILDFGIGPKLATYISRYSKNISLKELQRIQKVHYGFIKLDGEDLRSYFETINKQLDNSSKSVVFLPQGQQLKLLKFDDDQPKKAKQNKKTFVTWFSKLTEAVFVHTRHVRQLKNRGVRPGRPVINVLNAKPQWLTKVF